MKRRSLALAASLLLALTACDDDGDGPTGPSNLDFGEFEAEISSSFSQTMQGQALFSEGSDGSEILLYDVNVSGNAGQAIGILRYDEEPFRRGTQPIGDYRGNDFPLDQPLGIFLLFQPASGGGVNSRTFVSTGGSLTITDVFSNELRGRLVFNAVEELENASGELVTGTATVRVEASFRAERCTFDCEPTFSRLPLGNQQKVSVPLF